MKGKKAQEIREDRTQRVDAIRPEAGSVRPEKMVFLLMQVPPPRLDRSDYSEPCRPQPTEIGLAESNFNRTWYDSLF